jgi:hypothetical protein
MGSQKCLTNLVRVPQDDEAHALLAEFPGVIPAPHGVPGPILARMDLSSLDCNRTAAVAAGRRFRCRCWAQNPEVCRRPGSSAAQMRRLHAPRRRSSLPGGRMEHRRAGRGDALRGSP